MITKFTAKEEYEKGKKDTLEQIKNYLLKQINRPNARRDIWSSKITECFEEVLEFIKKEITTELINTMNKSKKKDAKPNSFLVKKIVKKSPINVEWELHDDKPSDWLMSDFPKD